MRKRKAYQVVDDVELVVLSVPGVDPAMLLLPHVIPQRALVPEGLLTVQALQAGDGHGGQPRLPHLRTDQGRPPPPPVTSRVLAEVTETPRGDVRPRCLCSGCRVHACF